LSAWNVEAQETDTRSIKGRVYEITEDKKKQPLTGVTVETTDHTAGTQTDVDGRFELEVPETVKEVVVSYIGYSTDTVQLKDKDNSYNITLQKPRQLEEVVVSVRQKSTQVGL